MAVLFHFTLKSKVNLTQRLFEKMVAMRIPKLIIKDKASKTLMLSPPKWRNRPSEISLFAVTIITHHVKKAITIPKFGQ